MRVTVVGGGNIGTQLAVHCAEAGHEVTVYTSTPQAFGSHLNIVDDDGVTTHEGVISLATSDPEKAFGRAAVILVTVPATMMKSTACTIFENTSKDVLIGVVPGNGGGECAFRRCIERGNTFFALERVPAIARLVQKGRTVRSSGYRKELHVAAIPEKSADLCAEMVREIFRMPCKTIPCMLSLTLTPSNPILHTSRLYGLFRGWREGMVYDSVPLFYSEWDDRASEVLFQMNAEEQRICRALPEFKLSNVVSLTEYYQAPTIEAMTKKIRSIPAFRGLGTPVLHVDGGVIPNLKSRYFTADFSYGLSIIQQVGRMSRVETPVMDEVMRWYKSIAVVRDEFCFADYGIVNRRGLKAFYLR